MTLIEVFDLCLAWVISSIDTWNSWSTTKKIIVGLPWMLSCITIYMNILAGNKKNHAWVVGLIGQVFWSIWILISENWGFVPLNIALWYVYFSNHRKWNKAT